MSKLVPISMLIFIFLSIRNQSYCQLWKQYIDSANFYNNQKKINKSIEFYEKAKQELGYDSIWTDTHAQTCNNLALLYETLGQFEKSEPLYLQVREIYEKIFGKENSTYVLSNDQLGVLYFKMMQFEKAESIFFESRQIWGRIVGRKGAEYATSCDNLGIIYMKMTQYEKAELFFLEAKNIREKVLGKKDPGYISSCDHLASLYVKMDQPKNAEPLYLEAKDLRLSTIGTDNPDYASNCNALANLYFDMNQYKKAETLYIEAKNIREKLLFKSPSAKGYMDYAVTLECLASSYAIREFEKAESFFLEAKRIRENILEKKDKAYLVDCYALANLYWFSGQYKKAEIVALEAIEIIKKILGKDDTSFTVSFAKMGKILADIYSATGQYTKAEPLYLDIKNITEKLGKNSIAYEQICTNLANLYSSQNKYGKAESFYLEAKQVIEEIIGKKSDDYSQICNNLAGLYLYQNQYEKAETLYLEAVRITGTVLNQKGPYYVSLCNNLGVLYGCIQQPEKAKSYFLEGFETNKIFLDEGFDFTTELEKQSDLKEDLRNKNDIFSFYTRKCSPSQQGFSYDVSLYYRNLVSSFYQRLRDKIHMTNDTSAKNKYNRWINLREQISFWRTKPISVRPDFLKALDKQADSLERELVLLDIIIKSKNKTQFNWKSVQQSLKKNEAAIEFIVFDFYDGKRWTDSIYCIALILRKDKPEPELVYLFEKKQLDTLLKNANSRNADSDKINFLYKSNAALYNLVWKPLEKKLAGIKKVFFASSGDLFKISFAALPVNPNEVLGDKYQLVQLNSTASVTNQIPTLINSSDTLQLYGGIDYDADSITLKRTLQKQQVFDFRGQSLSDDLRGNVGDNWTFLGGTASEVRNIENLGKQMHYYISTYTDAAATEESIKALNGRNSPAVIHIATHGFFFPDPKVEKKDLIYTGFEKGEVFKQSDDPLFRSGLLLAGANKTWNGKAAEGLEDGILTSYEISNLYLPTTKLAVLSACETGLGDIQGSEGVYGLQRAFKIAGVQNLVMSLWKVPDRETSEFMQLFYKNMFEKQSVGDAFYNAQSTMKKIYRNEPYKWAAWVLVR